MRLLSHQFSEWIFRLCRRTYGEEKNDAAPGSSCLWITHSELRVPRMNAYEAEFIATGENRKNAAKPCQAFSSCF
jgi:hypothetical protein